MDAIRKPAGMAANSVASGPFVRIALETSTAAASCAGPTMTCFANNNATKHVPAMFATNTMVHNRTSRTKLRNVG